MGCFVGLNMCVFILFFCYWFWSAFMMFWEDLMRALAWVAFFIPSGVLDFDELCLIFMDAVIVIVSGMLNEI